MTKRVLTVILVCMALVMLALVLIAYGHKTPSKASSADVTSSTTSSTASADASGTPTGPGKIGGPAVKKHIASTSLLTNEMTSKGVVSLGDSAEKVFLWCIHLMAPSRLLIH